MLETIGAKMPTAPKYSLPKGSCDCHAHIFGPLEEFPAGKSSYAIPLAAPSVYEKYLEIIGLSHGVIVQPAPYGQDTGALVNALEIFGDRLRGIAVADSSVSDEKLQMLHAAGVRGLRFIEKIDPRTQKPYAGSVGVSELKKMAARMQKLGWQAHIWTTGDELPRIYKELNSLEMPIVFDHMGQLDTAQGVGSLGFKALLDVLKDARVWLKMSVCRVSAQPPEYPDLRPYHDIIVDNHSQRLIWGSDWPFVAMREKSPDVGALVDLFCTWVNDDGVVQKVFADNPKRLFGF